MSAFKIGVMTDSFRCDLKHAIKKAAKMGADGVQLYATEGWTSPENMTSAKRRELLNMLKSNGLTVSALCGDMGGYGFSIEADNARRIERSIRIMDLAKDLESNIVTTHIGVIPESPEHPRWKVLHDACGQLGDYAEELGACFAIETGPEPASTLKRFLDSLHSGGIKVNLDPANLVMVTGDDPVSAVYKLRDYIVHTHAKDGVMLQKTNPELIYSFFAEGGIEDVHLEDYFRETPLGKGMVDFDAYLSALDDIGYRGFLTVEREVGENPEADISAAVDFLKAIKGGKLLNKQKGVIQNGH